jgi:hypothetical protein
MMKTTSELKTIAQSGARLIVSAHNKTTGELKEIIASTSQAVVIRNVDSKTTNECRELGAAGKLGQVTLDFS